MTRPSHDRRRPPEAGRRRDDVIVTAAVVVLAASLVWGLRSLIVPVSVGGLLAYICRPLVARLERYWIPRGLGVGLLLLVFGRSRSSA